MKIIKSIMNFFGAINNLQKQVEEANKKIEDLNNKVYRTRIAVAARNSKVSYRTGDIVYYTSCDPKWIKVEVIDVYIDQITVKHQNGSTSKWHEKNLKINDRQVIKNIMSDHFPEMFKQREISIENEVE